MATTVAGMVGTVHHGMIAVEAERAHGVGRELALMLAAPLVGLAFVVAAPFIGAAAMAKLALGPRA